MPCRTPSTRTNIKRLIALFEARGSMRVPDAARREKSREDGTRSYKKGYEVRFVIFDEEDLDEVLDMLHRVGLKPGQPYSKVNQIVIPVYGREQVYRFADLAGIDLSDPDGHRRV